MSTFKPGDIVTIISGGPHMTIHSVVDGLIKVSWFSKALQSHVHEVFAVDQLNLVRSRVIQNC